MKHNKRYLILLCILLCCKQALAEGPVALEGILRSKNTGKIITRMPVILETKSIEKGEYVLMIGSRSGITASNGSKKSLMIFSQKLSVWEFKSVNATTETGNIVEFMPFCNNKDVIFDIPKYKEIEGLSVFPFSTKAPSGEKLRISLCMYLTSKNRTNKTVVEEETQMILEFTIPHVIVAETKKSDAIITTLSRELEPEESIVSLTPEELEKKAIQRDDSILKVRTSDLNDFIILKNQELNAFFPLVGNMTKGDKDAAEALAALVNKLNENVKIKKDGNISIISNNDMLGEKFAFFGTQYNDLLLKIENLKITPPETNWVLIIGMALGVFMLGGMFFMQIWNSIKAKRQQRDLARQAEEALRGNLLQNVNKDLLPKV